VSDDVGGLVDPDGLDAGGDGEPKPGPAGLVVLVPGWRVGQTVGGGAELGRDRRRTRSRAAMLIRIRVLNEQVTGTGLTDQPRS
jgi:hypothetical protein